MAARNLDKTFAALADPHRREVVDLLRKRPMRAGELSAKLGMTPPAMSRHLRLLRRSGLVGCQAPDPSADARVRLYELRRGAFEGLRNWLNEVESFWVEELSAFRDHVEKRK